MSNKTKPFVVAIVGPTAVGKSAYAVTLAKKLNGEIISADSRQIYRGLDIGSGKITKKEMGDIPHHLLDVASPKKVFSVHDFKRIAEPIIKDILARGKTPIVVGGTGFYIDALLGGVSLPNVPPNNALRKKLGKLTLSALVKKLKKLDPKRAKVMDLKNKVRVIRAIEIATELGSVPVIRTKKLPFEVRWIGLTTSREKLRKNIVKRLNARLVQGMLKEVVKLHKQGVSWKRMNELGLEYRYCALYLQGKLTEAQLIKTLTEKIYQYAMRQFRWFKRNKQIKWIKV